MDKLIYPRERTLGTITLVLGIIVWLALIAGTMGVALLYVLLAFVAYVFAQTAWLAWLRGTAVRILPDQYPDLHDRFEKCCATLEVKDMPEAYLLNGNGAFNAFAGRFFGKHFVVLLSDVVDAFEGDPDSINFYIGHELAHIRLKHMTGHLWRMPALWLPLVGAAYARAKEYSCDRHGRACCETPEAAARALLVLGSGPGRVRTTNMKIYARQLKMNLGFWASFHEIIAGYPWLIKRVAVTLDPEKKMPNRNPLAYVLGLFVPHGGGAGGAAGFFMLVAMIGILAAVALPAYQDYTNKAVVAQAWQYGGNTRQALSVFYAQSQRVPTLVEAEVSDTLPDKSHMTVNPDNMVVQVETRVGTLLMTPEKSASAPNGIAWRCEAGEGLKATWLPKACVKAQ